MKILKELKNKMRQVFTVFCATLILLVTCFGVFSQGNQALAKSLTPEAKSYQVDKSNDLEMSTTDNPMTETKDKAESFGENIVEKLNLDEPLPEDTKKFFRQIQGKEPIKNEKIPETKY